jgi:hypothetical protein
MKPVGCRRTLDCFAFGSQWRAAARHCEARGAEAIQDLCARRDMIRTSETLNVGRFQNSNHIERSGPVEEGLKFPENREFIREFFRFRANSAESAPVCAAASMVYTPIP